MRRSKSIKILESDTEDDDGMDIEDDEEHAKK